MWGRWIIDGIAVISFLTYGQALPARELFSNDLPSGKMRDTSASRDSLSRFPLKYNLDYSFSLASSMFFNMPDNNNKSSISLLQSLKLLMSQGNRRNLKLTNQLVHNLGLLHFTDSITLFQPDDNTLNTRLDTRLKDKFSLQLSSVLSTRLMNGFDYYINDSGTLVRILNSSFLTPLTGVFSFGVGLNCPLFGTVSMGLSSGKLTYIYNTRIFGIRETENFWGVPKTKFLLFEYGLSLQVLVEKELFKRMHFDCDLLIFKKYNAPVDFTMKTLLGFKINRFIKISVLTKILYEKMVSKKIRIESYISAGFNVIL